MHALPILKQACLEALETDGEPGDPGRFFSLVDPGSVLELIEIAKTSITDEEVLALHRVIGQLRTTSAGHRLRPKRSSLCGMRRQWSASSISKRNLSWLVHMYLSERFTRSKHDDAVF